MHGFRYKKSDSSVDREPQGNWRWNSNSNDVVASSPSFLPPRRQSAPESLLADYCYPLKITSPQWFYTKVFTHCFSKPDILSKYLGVSLNTQTFTAADFYLTQYIKHESTYCTKPTQNPLNLFLWEIRLIYFGYSGFTPLYKRNFLSVLPEHTLVLSYFSPVQSMDQAVPHQQQLTTLSPSRTGDRNSL